MSRIFLCLALLAGLSFALTAEASESPRLTVEIGGRGFSAIPEDNATAGAFSGLLPLTLDMNELNGNEKYCYLSQSLPSRPEKIGKIQAGDIMLYGDNCLVIFYKSFSTSYRYTRIGRIENPSALESAVGKGNVTVEFKR